MFAFPKLIVIILIVVAAWVSYRWLNGLTRELTRRRPRSPGSAINVENLVACTICGAYVAASAPSCGRPDCPRSR
jgi:hypothetical protein